MECKFCKKEVNGEIIYKDDFVYAIISDNPLSTGHSVVIPYEHYETFFEIPEEKYQQIFSSLKKIIKLIKEKTNFKGYNIVINNGKMANQKIPHIHVHVIPRFENDGIHIEKNEEFFRNNYRELSL